MIYMRYRLSLQSDCLISESDSKNIMLDIFMVKVRSFTSYMTIIVLIKVLPY